MKNVFFVLCMIAAVIAGSGESGIAGSISINIDNTEGVTEVEIGGGKSNVGVVTTGCIEGSGIKKTEQRKVSSFKAVDVDGAFNVNIELRKKQSLEITGDDNILPYIITKSAGDTLRITTDKSICPKKDLVVSVSTGNIEKVSSNGANDIFISGVKNESLTLKLDGAGDASASGTTKKFVVKIAGSGNLHAKDLHAEEVRISISGVGDADVYASKKLLAEIEGVGEISYYGNPKEVSKSITGVGDIEKKE